MALSTLPCQFTRIYRLSTIRNFSVISATKSSLLLHFDPLPKCDKSTTNTCPLIIPNQKNVLRGFCSESQKLSDPPKRSLPQLMAFPEIVWPSVLKTIKNWILTNFIIRPYFDRDFSLPEFVAGTKQALQIVSTKISDGDLAPLKGLVADETVAELKASVAKMSVAQRSEISVSKDDIFLSFPYQIGIMFDESNEKTQKRWVEITMVFHVLRGLREMQERGQAPPLNLGMMPEYQEKMSICNYRFIKEFTQGFESDWTINVVNHFKPSDYINE